MLLIRKFLPNLKKIDENPLRLLVTRLLDLYDAGRKRGMNQLALKLLLRVNSKLRFEFAEFFNEDVKKIAFDNWKNIDGGNLNFFLTIFEIRDRITPEDIVPTINEHLANRKLNDVVSYISTLNLQHLFNIPEIVSMLVNQNKFPLAANLVGKDTNLQKDLIAQMTTNKFSSKAADLVKAFKLNPKDFPELVRRLQKNCLRYYEGQDNWMKVEEKFYDLDYILGYFIEDLIYKQSYDIALSIMKRHDLWNKKCIEKPDTIQELEPFFTDPPTKTYNYVENTLFTIDEYSPTEELIGDAPVGTYWHFKDCGIDVEKDLIWVEDPESEVFELATKDILSSEAVGLDSEFRMSMTKFDKSGTALLQLANDRKIYLMDALKMSDSPKYNAFLHELFTDAKILKIGHTLTADLEILKNDRADGSELVIRNHLDLPRVFKGLFPELTQSSLAYICEKITKKPMSKYEQISNWNRRPLRKSQIHYAAMDAFILLKIYEEMKKVLESIGDDITRFIDSSIGGVIVGKKSKKKEREEEEEKEEDLFKDDENGEENEELTKEKNEIKSNPKPLRQKKTAEERKEEKKTQAKSEKKKEKEKDMIQFYADEKYADFYNDPSTIKFVVDNMAMKLAKYLRNIGQDAEYLATKDHNELTELAKTEKRVIVTRDTRYFAKRTGVPCFFLKSQKTTDQLNELIEFFKIKVASGNFLSRCVKCNHEGLVIITTDEARKQLQWKLDDYDKYDEYWQCEKCKQVYWEGNTFKRAQNRFKEFAGAGEEDEDEDEDEFAGFSANLGDSAGQTQTTGLGDDNLQNFEFAD